MENKYMKLIEQITCCNWYEDDKTKAKMFDKIYQISHIANNRCLNEHKNRRSDVDKLIIEFNN